MNYAIIGANILIYLVTDLFGAAAAGGFGDGIKERYLLNPAALSLPQFVTYQFLHGDILHLLGNMWFLWIFGNSVNSKMGHVAYLLFYLSAGIFAGVGFAMWSNNPCIGASGAIAGVTTAFLVLFPHSQVTMFYWLWFYVGTWHIKAVVLIVLKIIIWDNLLAPRLTAGGLEQVAYEAHIAGYIYGFVVCFVLLFLRALPRDQYDILALAKRHYQRQQLRAAMATPEAEARATYGRVAASTAGGGSRNDAGAAPEDAQSLMLRARIAENVGRGDLDGAVAAYDELMARDSSQVLARQMQLAVANHLKTLGQYPQSVAAYGKFLDVYPRDAEAPRVKLMLGIIYAKYLEKHETAEAYLRESAESLKDPEQREQASQWLQTVVAALGRGGTSPA